MTGHSRGVLDRVLKVCTADSLRTVVSPKKVLEKYPAPIGVNLVGTFSRAMMCVTPR
jgi:hypothetical protein